MDREPLVSEPQSRAYPSPRVVTFAAVVSSGCLLSILAWVCWSSRLSLSGRSTSEFLAARTGPRQLGKNELHVATVKEEVKDLFNPAVCAGQSLQAAMTLAGLSIKVAGAMKSATPTGMTMKLQFFPTGIHLTLGGYHRNPATWRNSRGIQKALIQAAGVSRASEGQGAIATIDPLHKHDTVL